MRGKWNAGSAVLDYRFEDKDGPVLVVETALGSCKAEWDPFVDRIKASFAILTYDRAGYGFSSRSKLARTPLNTAEELHSLIQGIIPGRNLILIGHSLGGLYVQHYVRMHPEDISGAVLIDPATTEDRRFRERLTPEEYQGSGVDKSLNYKIGALIGRTGLLFLLKPLLKQGIPFYYRPGYSSESEKEILKHMTRGISWRAALEEYRHYNEREQVLAGLQRNSFPSIPVRILYHNPDVVVREIVQYGGLSETQAFKVENIWREIIRECYLNLSPDAEGMEAEKSGHFIHLTEPDLVEKALVSLV